MQHAHMCVESKRDAVHYICVAPNFGESPYAAKTAALSVLSLAKMKHLSLDYTLGGGGVCRSWHFEPAMV